jgi:hypothetical protein
MWQQRRLMGPDLRFSAAVCAFSAHVAAENARGPSVDSPQLADDAAGGFDVVVELGDEGFDAVELSLAAQEADEANFGALAVDVFIEIEQMRFEQRMIGVLVERRTPAEVDGTRVHDTVGPFLETGVHTVGREAHLARHLDVGGGESDQAAPLVAAHDDAARLERAAQQERGDVDVAAGQRPTHGGRRHRLVDPVGA